MRRRAPDACSQDLRASIDNIDAAIVHMLAERFRCTKEVGRAEGQHNLPPADPAREKDQIERLRKLAKTPIWTPISPRSS